jgi:hypothetical protein
MESTPEPTGETDDCEVVDDDVEFGRRDRELRTDNSEMVDVVELVDVTGDPEMVDVVELVAASHDGS